jgi:fucose permease
MNAAVVALIVSVVAAVVFLTSGGRDRFRMIIGGLWGLVMGVTIGESVTGVLGKVFGALGGFFGA